MFHKTITYYNLIPKSEMKFYYSTVQYFNFGDEFLHSCKIYFWPVNIFWITTYLCPSVKANLILSLEKILEEKRDFVTQILRGLPQN